MASGTGIGEFYISLFVDAADGGLTVSNLVQGFGQLEIATIGEIALLWELGTMLARFTDAGIKASLGFEQFTMHTGLSAQVLQKWQIAAELSHASAQDVTTSMENLTKNLKLMALGEDTPLRKAFQFLGIAGEQVKDADDALKKIHERLALTTPDAGMQALILQWASVSPNLREMLTLRDEVLKNRQTFVSGMSGGQEKQFDHLRETMVEIELRTRQIGINIGAWVSPAVQKIFDILNTAAGLELKGGGAWADAFKRAHEGLDKSKKEGKPFEFKDSVLGQIIYGVEKPGGQPYEAQLKDLGMPSIPAERAPAQVNIEKHDTINIHEAHDPHKIADIMDQRWDETMGRKVIDGFDRQLNNGGF